jgi:hypothetical protein
MGLQGRFVRAESAFDTRSVRARRSLREKSGRILVSAVRRAGGSRMRGEFELGTSEHSEG